MYVAIPSIPDAKKPIYTFRELNAYYIRVYMYVLIMCGRTKSIRVTQEGLFYFFSPSLFGECWCACLHYYCFSARSNEQNRYRCAM